MQKRINCLLFIAVVLSGLLVCCAAGRIVKTNTKIMPDGATHKYTYYRDLNGNEIYHGKYKRIMYGGAYVETKFYKDGKEVGVEYYTKDSDLSLERKKTSAQ